MINIIRDPNHEPEWSDVGLRATDFRPTFDGDLVNVFSVIHPLETRLETESYLRKCASEVAQWILVHQNEFSVGDRFQIILGLPKSVRESNRQIVKTGGTFDELHSQVESPSEILFLPKWDYGLFENTTEQTR